MNKIENVLSSIIWILLPVVFIGSASLVIPNFEAIYRDMYEGSTLPNLTRVVFSIPLLAWPLIALLFAIFNIYTSRKAKNGPFLAASFITMIIISGAIVIGLFLPSVGGIYTVIEDPQTKSEPGAIVNASAAAGKSDSHLHD